MKLNVGGVEQRIRIALGVLILLAGYLAGMPVWAAATAYILGAVLLITGAVQFCPLWAALGINTHALGMGGTGGMGGMGGTGRKT